MFVFFKRCNFLSVMLTMIYIWHKYDIDVLVLARTPPGNSYKNPVERVMSTLNLGFQAVGLMRARDEDKEMEDRISK